jgi:hypothetical protein
MMLEQNIKDFSVNHTHSNFSYASVECEYDTSNWWFLKIGKI